MGYLCPPPDKFAVLSKAILPDWIGVNTPLAFASLAVYYRVSREAQLNKRLTRTNGYDKLILP